MLSDSDHQQIISRGSAVDVVEQQIENFKNEFPPLQLIGPAVDGNGILVLDEQSAHDYAKKYSSLLGDKSVVKFVPASGAASRMFKSLFAFVDEYKGTDEDYDRFSSGGSHQAVYEFFKAINHFAFYDDLKAAYDQQGEALEESHLKRNYVGILKTLLGESGLNYGNLPKGLLKFHSYGENSRTPAEEHLVEGAHYAKDASGKVRLHFTVSPEHRVKFNDHIEQVRAQYESEFGVTYEVEFSEQKKSTDTVAVDLNNNPFREDDNSILFRPAGHGALIANLDDLATDIVFIKNIDNVVPDHLKEDTYLYKKVIAGVMLEAQQKVFGYLERIDEDWSQALEEEIVAYGKSHLNFQLPRTYNDLSSEERRELLHAKLNRPIRTSGMVSNIGDPGGGPFWAANSDGSVSLQIVETAQIDLDNSGQKEIFGQSTHFNPVDLVCGVKNYKGEKFDLTQYVDPATGFITLKSKDGKDLKAQELPGLWNGAMSDWISIFVEVPATTFNPVKQVNDLLKKTHQPA